MKKFAQIAFILGIPIMLVNCWSSHKIESVHEIKPIHIVIDINLKVDRELDDYFGDLDASEDKLDNRTNKNN